MCQSVGFIGLGRMGFPMARHLVGAGFEVTGFDVSEEARARAGAAGIKEVSDISALRETPVVLSSLPNTPEVRLVYGLPAGVLGLLDPGSLCIDLSTISVTASCELAAAAAQRGIGFLDAPVSGTAIHAEAGSLAIMVGGDPEAVDRARPYLESFSSSVHHVGPNGSGLQMKLITNRLLTTHLVGIAEAIVEMEAAGLEVDSCLDLLRAGAVPRLLEYKAGPMAKRDFSPQFTVDLMGKDLGLAEQQRPAGRLARVAVAIVREAQEAGLGEQDLGAVIEVVSGIIPNQGRTT
jgi:2-hydroxy-3-oxopropionate reductase